MDFSTLDIQFENEGSALTSLQKNRLNNMLNSNADLYENHGPPSPHATHHIVTDNHSPISSPPYRMSPQRNAILRAEVENLLENDIVEACQSAWAALVVLVPKPDGKTRLCVDYRKLNAITKPDVYPLPRIEDLLHSTGNATFISTMDLKAGYYQVKVSPEDRDKTAFITPFGVYRFKRLPFGLRNAPATFQRLIGRGKIGLSDITLLAYLDDLILLSPTAQNHLENLQRTFDQLRSFNLRMNRPKCRFACNEVKYLGHVVSEEGIRPDPGKTRAIQDMPTPRNVQNVLTFLQTCSWYRKFIPNFSEVARPLSQLTRKNSQFE
jgi:hypothetical protein